MNKLLLLILGGSLGTLCRYFLAEWGQARWGVWLPYGTLLVNVTGCFMLGCLLGFFESRGLAWVDVPLAVRLLLVTGFLGAMTTFSSYELEALLYLRQGLWERALLYLAGSVVLGLLAMLLGVRISRFLGAWLL